MPDILYDGIMDPKTVDASGNLKAEYRICLRNNGKATFANLDAENDFKNIQRDIQQYNCEREALAEPSLTSSR